MRFLLRGFRNNGRGDLRGTLVAVNDSGIPLGWEHTANWSNARERKLAVMSCMEGTGQEEDVVRALVVQALKEVRTAVEQEVELPSPPGSPSMRARFPHLVDIVRDGEEVGFLVVGDSGPNIIPEAYGQEGLLVPPDPEYIPFPMADAGAVLYHHERDDDRRLFQDLVSYHGSVSELPGEDHFRFVALWVLHTYLFEKFDYSPVLGLVAVQERGKSRTGKGVAYVSYRGLVTETLNEANLFRWSHLYSATVFFDVLNLWRKAERKGAEDILLNRYERGGKVARVIDPKLGDFRDTKYFDIFGPTLFAANTTPPEPYLSRCVIITMPETTRSYAANVVPETGKELRERLLAFRCRWLDRELPQAEKPVPGRLGDILQPIVQVASLLGEDVYRAALRAAQTFYVERMQDRAGSREALLTLAVEAAFQETEGDAVTIDEIVKAYNSDLPEKEQRSATSIGVRVRALGFRRNPRHGGRRAIVRDDVLVEALKRKYGLVEDGTPLQGCVSEVSQGVPTSPSDRGSALGHFEEKNAKVSQNEGRPAQRVPNVSQVDPSYDLGHWDTWDTLHPSPLTGEENEGSSQKDTPPDAEAPNKPTPEDEEGWSVDL